MIDIGVNDPLAEAPGLIQKKIKSGTDNIARGPAMSLDEAVRAIEVGIELAQAAAQEGVTLIGTGEMGIANTTPSSAVFAALLPCPVEVITGRGTGIDDPTLTHKIRIIQQSLEVNRARLTDPLERLGGLRGSGDCRHLRDLPGRRCGADTGGRGRIHFLGRGLGGLPPVASGSRLPVFQPPFRRGRPPDLLHALWSKALI